MTTNPTAVAIIGTRLDTYELTGCTEAPHDRFWIACRYCEAGRVRRRQEERSRLDRRLANAKVRKEARR